MVQDEMASKSQARLDDGSEMSAKDELDKLQSHSPVVERGELDVEAVVE